MNLKYRAIHAFRWSITDKLINQLGYLFISVYLARLIGPESFGLIGMVTIFMLLADSVVSSGFSSALVQRSQRLTEDDANSVFWVNLCWGFSIYSVFYLAAPQIADFYREPQLVEIARVLFLVIIINAFTIVARAKLTIAFDFKSQAIANTFGTLVSSVLAVVLAHYGYGYWSLVWLMLSKSMLVSIFICLFCPWFPKLRFSRASFSSLFGFGSRLMLAGFVATIVNNLYAVLIGRFYNAAQVGFFTQATNLSNYLSQFVASSLQGVTFPIMTSVKEDRERLLKIYYQLISITMLVSLPILLGFAAIADDFVYIFLGEEWLPCVPVLVALCIARTITPISAINMNILNAVGRSDLFLKVDIAKLPITLTALFVALPYGIEGLAWAIVCTSFAAFFINAWYPGKLFDYGASKQLVIALPYISASAIMFFSLDIISSDFGIGTVIAKICIGVLVYTTSLWVMNKSLIKSFVTLLLERH